MIFTFHLLIVNSSTGEQFIEMYLVAKWNEDEKLDKKSYRKFPDRPNKNIPKSFGKTHEKYEIYEKYKAGESRK